MSTRCRIAIQNKDQSYNSIYCHFDGYPQHTGKLLAQYWTNIENVSSLINSGDVSVLDRSYQKTKFYSREYNTAITQALIAKDLDELLQQTQDCGGEYVYAYINNHWFYHFSENDGTSWIPIIVGLTHD